MRWRQFFTPVQSINTEKAKKLINDTKTIGIVDVRQPGEYKQGHIAGAQLMPLPQLSDSLVQLERQKPLIVYCAIGGRSRIAAQQLAGEGFQEVYNLSGGYKAWAGLSAFGTETQGTEFFTVLSSSEDVIMTAYSLEDGLKDFYLKMMKKAFRPEAVKLFEDLAHVEDLHKDKLFQEYIRLSGNNDRDGFEKKIQKHNMEGGITTEEYLLRFQPDLDNLKDIIGLAMSIEAQALDLYSRASHITDTAIHAKLLTGIAEEEKRHLKILGFLLDSIMEASHD